MQRVFARPFKHHAVFPCVYRSWKWCATMGKIKFLLPNLLFTLLAISLVLQQLPHTNLLFSSLCLICQQPFGVSPLWFRPHLYSPAVSPGCTHQNGSQTLFRGAGPRTIRPHLGWNVQESQAPNMSCCGSTFKTFPRRTLPDWILACDASCMLMKSSSSSWTLQTHSLFKRA